MEENIITVNSVYKTFVAGFWRKRYTHALNGVSMEIRKGEIFGILGQNGAGKTTLLNILSTQLVPDSGEVRILNNTIDKDRTTNEMDLKSRMNMCSGNPNFPWSLTVKEVLVFYSMIYGLKRSKIKEMVNYCIEKLELKKYENIKYDELSTGTKQRLALAKALLNEPEILLLDEPTIGLDPDMAKKIRNLVREIHKKGNVTILLTTHYMKEAEELCERIAFIKDGRIRAIGTSEELKKMTNTTDLEGVFLEFVN